MGKKETLCILMYMVCTGIYKNFLHFSSQGHWYEANSLIVGSSVTGNVMCQQIAGLDLSVSVRVATKQETWLQHFQFAPSKNRDMLYDFYGQKVCKVLKFTHIYMLIMGTIPLGNQAALHCAFIRAGLRGQYTHSSSFW